LLQAALSGLSPVGLLLRCSFTEADIRVGAQHFETPTVCYADKVPKRCACKISIILESTTNYKSVELSTFQINQNKKAPHQAEPKALF
jgi:hypothetical protein